MRIAERDLRTPVDLPITDITVDIRSALQHDNPNTHESSYYCCNMVNVAHQVFLSIKLFNPNLGIYMRTVPNYSFARISLCIFTNTVPAPSNTAPGPPSASPARISSPSSPPTPS